MLLPLLVLILCSLLIWIFVIKCNSYNYNHKKEHFQWDPLAVGKTSLDCYTETTRDCTKYSNCGLCFKNGKGKCIFGDVNGPFTKANCDGWMYTNYYDRHIFGDKVTTYNVPWSHIYNFYEVWYPSTVSNASLL